MVIDRLGIFVGRCLSASMSLLGFVALTLVVQYPFLLWISCPLIAAGGLANHMTNMPMARSIPLLSSAFQALTAGCISGVLFYGIIYGMYFLLASAACVIRERQMRNDPREEVLLKTTH